MRSLANEARVARHLAVLDEATWEFSRAGVAGASLGAIAQRVGLTRAGLYNYCADRHDLVHQCYLRACALIQTDLHRAAATPSNGLDKVAAFLRLALDVDHPPVAVLSELGFLSGEQQASIREARGKNVSALRSLVAEGIEDGSIRACDLDITCVAIFGILSWAPLSRYWIDFEDATLASRMSTAIPSLIMEGAAAEGVKIPKSRKRLADIVRVEHKSDRDKRLETLARAGSRLFNERGIDGVSLDEVAAAVGLTKGAVYHAFDSKPAFVAYCYHRAFDLYERIMDVAEAGATGVEYMMIATELNVEAQLIDLHPLWMTIGFDMFPNDLRRDLVARSGALLQRSIRRTERDLQDGSLRPFDPLPVKLAWVGSFGYLSQWLPEGGDRPPAEIAQEISHLLMLGLRPRAGSHRKARAAHAAAAGAKTKRA